MRQPSEDAALERLVHVIRGHRVMLGDDLAGLYGVTPKVLTRAVKRNLRRFPAPFMLVVPGSKNKAYAFTAEGVGMVAAVLKTPQAVQVNISIVRAVVKERQIKRETDDFERQMAVVASCIAECERGEYGLEIRGVFEAMRVLIAPPAEPKVEGKA